MITSTSVIKKIRYCANSTLRGNIDIPEFMGKGYHAKLSILAS